MSDTTIDEIFAEFGRKCSPVATLRNVDNPLVRREYIDQAKSALYDLIDTKIIEELEILLNTTLIYEQDPEALARTPSQIIKDRIKELKSNQSKGNAND